MKMLLKIVFILTLLEHSSAEFKCHKKIDIMMLLDCSASVTEDQFKEIKKFAKDLVRYFDISKDKTNLAIASFSQYVHQAMVFNKEASLKSALKAIDGLQYEGSFSRLDFALEAVQGVFLAKTRRSATGKNVKRVLISITDGFSSRGIGITKESTDTMKKQDVELFSVAIADRYHKVELNELASKPVENHQLITGSKSTLSKEQIKRFAQQICNGE